MWPFKTKGQGSKSEAEVPLIDDPLAAQVGLQGLVQEISVMAAEEAHDPTGKILLYAEVQPGVTSVDLFSRRTDGVLRYRHASRRLFSLVYQYWEESAAAGELWATISCVIERGRFGLSFQYQDAVDLNDPSGSARERRRNIIHHHFGEVQVDYSSPGAVRD